MQELGGGVRGSPGTDYPGARARGGPDPYTQAQWRNCEMWLIEVS